MLEAVAVAARGEAPLRSGEVLRRLSRRAADLAGQGRHRDAVLVWEELAAIVPDREEVAAGLGAALLASNENRRAAHVLAKATDRFPDNALLLRLHAQALVRIGDSASAVGALYLALQLDPDSSAIRGSLSQALHQQRKPAAALPHAVAAFDAEPNVSNSALLTGILIDLGRSEEALAVVERFEAGAGELASKYVLRSLCLQLLDRDEEALCAARDAVAAAPDDQYARCGLGMSLLLRGQLTAEAWSLYDSRASLLGVHSWPSPERRWTGGDLTGKTLLVHAEQGFGDTLQFGRFIPLLVDRGATVIFAVQPALRRLLENVRGADQVVSGGGATLPEFDVYCPLLSLPGVLGTTIDTIPPPLELPVFPPPAERGDDLQVGVIWSGSGVFVDDARRSLDPALLAPLADIAGVTFHSLQYGATSFPLPGMIDAMQGVVDFADTAARVAGLDLVISVDTSVAHLAATMGKPVWLLSRKSGCWRWMQGRSDSPWYPSVRLYRQSQVGDWSDVIESIYGDLAFVVGKFEEIKAQAIEP